MKGNPVLYKGLVVGVIVLFVGIGIQPAFADTQLEEKDENYINITSEFTGLRKKHTVKMTQQGLEELDAFLDSLYVKLNNSQSDDETSQIINEAIYELDKYSLLCGLSVEQVKSIFSLYSRLKINKDFNQKSDTDNTNCLIIGKVTNSYFYSPLYELILSLYDNVLGELLFLFNTIFRLVAVEYGFPFFPLQIGSYITIGWLHDGFEWFYNPAKGWIVTIGTNGTKGWNGEFAGTLGSMPGMWSKFFIGVEGFFGLKIFNPLNDKTTLLGYAIKVGIEYD